MKTAVLVSGLLASIALAQPFGHGHNHPRRSHHHHHPNHHHDKRALVTEWVTETLYETVTALVDESTTELILPTKAAPAKVSSVTTSTQRPGQFFEGATAAPQAPAPEPAVTVAPAAPPAPSPAPPVIQSAPAPAPAPAAPAPAPAPPVVVDTPAPAPAAGKSPQAASSGSSSHHQGDLTYYELGLGACGFHDGGKDRSENIVALSHLLMGERSNDNPYCGRTVTISYGGKQVQAVVRDKCMGCAYDNIDGTEKIFLELAGGLTAGRFKVEWWFN